MRIMVDRISVDISVERSCLPNLWNQFKEVSRGKDRISNELNRYLEITRSKIHQIYRELETANKAITAEIIKNKCYGVDESKKTLIEAFEKHNAQVRQLIGKGFVEKTGQRYKTTKRYLAVY